MKLIIYTIICLTIKTSLTIEHVVSCSHHINCLHCRNRMTLDTIYFYHSYGMNHSYSNNLSSVSYFVLFIYLIFLFFTWETYMNSVVVYLTKMLQTKGGSDSKQLPENQLEDIFYAASFKSGYECGRWERKLRSFGYWKSGEFHGYCLLQLIPDLLGSLQQYVYTPPLTDG